VDGWWCGWELCSELGSFGSTVLGHYREGGKHSVYFSPTDRRTSSVPHHTEIADKLAQKICKDH